MPPHRQSYRPVVMGRRGMVASAHPLASAAGIQILLQGGNAVDSAVAVASTLSVAEPYMSGLGGIGLMIVFLAKGGERYVVDFVGTIPKAADPSVVRAADLEGGPRACVTPGSLAGWLGALERFGTMPPGLVLEPAIRMAEEGVPLTFKNCEFFEIGREILLRSAEAQRIYLSGDAHRPGSLLTQKDLAATYRQITEGGLEVFYAGPIGKAICRTVQENGGWLNEDDLASFVATCRSPLSMPFRDVEIITAPVPSLAFQFLETLSILENDSLSLWGHNSAEYLHHFIEAAKLANADRLRYAYLPEPPIPDLISKAYTALRRKRIHPSEASISEGERFSPERLPGEVLAGELRNFSREHTTHFACADAEGNVVTVTQTLGAEFGSGFAVPTTGIILNNLLQWTDVNTDSPNLIRPGERVKTNMSPAQVFRNERFMMSIGTPGSYGILQTTPQMLLNVLEFGMNIQEAIEAPRIRVYRDRLVQVEGRLPAEVRGELARLHHDVDVIDDWSSIVGSGQGIVRDAESGVFQGGADPRRDGYAIGI